MSEIPSIVNKNEVHPSGVSNSFDTGYAIAYGVDEAIMIRNLQFFITMNANRGHNFKEGRFWSYDKLNDFPKHFPYWTIKQVRRVISSLIKQDVIIKGSFNNSWSDRTSWYAFKDENKFIKHTMPPELIPAETPDLPKRANDKCPNEQLTFAQMGNSINDTTLSSTLSHSSSLKVSEDQSSFPAKAGEKRKKISSDFSEEIKQLADAVIGAIVAAKPNFAVPKSLISLMTSLDFMVREDRRDPQKILDVLRWALTVDFWRPQMMKADVAKFIRPRFDDLEERMKVTPKTFNKVDRRTKNMDGTPVDAPHLDGLF